MNRRHLLKSLGATAALACPLCASLGARAADTHWGYDGHGGPDHWGDLSPKNSACGLGAEQSPIDLRDGVKANPAPAALRWNPSKLAIVNNGHTIQVNTASDSAMTIGDQNFKLLQFHFHHPSEHLLAGKAQPMEVHFVHAADNGALAVVGVFMVEGKGNDLIETVWRAMPKQADKVESDAMIDPAGLLPEARSFFRYEGSLTTPPCSEIVTWTVYDTPVEVSAAQIADFASLFPNNARPVQPHNRRFLLTGS